MNVDEAVPHWVRQGRVCAVSGAAVLGKGVVVNGITIGGLNGSLDDSVVMDCGCTVDVCEIEADEIGVTVPPEIHAAADAGALTVNNSVMVLGAAVKVIGGAVTVNGGAVTT
jgi:hypothetical protein